MALKRYKEKRVFGQTPEPQGGRPDVGNALRFVVQKHEASHLHYDFRLELGGVLLSWAVPKGPSMDPSVKRMAIKVEDHPYDYKDFEGIIPEGNYGGGTVMVWDQGTYKPLAKANTKKGQERVLKNQLAEGSLKFELQGSKLKGEFALVKMHTAENDAWLLIKHRDGFASEEDILRQDRSVLSGRSMEGIRKAPQAIWHSDRPSGHKAPTPRAAPGPAKALGKKAPFPAPFGPMLAGTKKEPFDNDEWTFEVKWDGYRALAFMGEDVHLWSRKGQSLDNRFYPIYNALKATNIRAVLDGEVVCVDEKGMPDFGRLQTWETERDGRLVYYVFDILWWDGRDLCDAPLEDRQALLKEVLPQSREIALGFQLGSSGTALFEAVERMGLEGIMAKRKQSPYRPGTRSKDWLKIKTNQRERLAIIGYAQNISVSRSFASLLLGREEDGAWTYAGKVGTGFSDAQQRSLLEAFEPWQRQKSALKKLPPIKTLAITGQEADTRLIWLKPHFYAWVNYTEKTKDGLLRHPSYLGLDETRPNKKEKKTRPLVALAKGNGTITQEKKKPLAHAEEKKALFDPGQKQGTQKINGHVLKFTNLDKVYWPKEGYTKRDLIEYYHSMAPYILPYLKDRPQSLHRFPNGIEGKSFYQKDITGKVPEWVKLFPYATPEKKDKHYMLASDEASLLFMANSGAVEMHPWSSTYKHPEKPDWCVLDIDPSQQSTFLQVIETARTIKNILGSIGIEGYCKTSGATGLHVFIPLGSRYTYAQSQLFAHWIASLVHKELPHTTTLERMLDKRKGNIYIDYLQNKIGATIAAPYSVRPRPGATVSMPLHWEEVHKGLDVRDFTIRTAYKRVQEMGDIFKPVMGKGTALKKWLDKL